MNDNHKPLTGLTVIELAGVLAGPSVGMFLGELGAHVIKVENKTTGGDMTRKWKLPQENPNHSTSSYYASVNAFKQVVFKDLNLAEDAKWLLDKLKNADILIENFKPADRKKFNLERENLKYRFPNLIQIRVEGFPEGSQKTAFDAVLQAESGIISMTGTAEEFAKLPVAFIDLLAAHQLKEGVLIALLERMKTGKGCLVRCNLLHAALSSLANQASAFLMLNESAKPMGTLHPNIAPYGEIVESADHQKILLAIGTDSQFVKLCTIINCEELIEDPRYKTNQLRVQNRVSLLKALKKAFIKVDSNAINKHLSESNIPFGFIKTVGQALEHESAIPLLHTYQLGEETLKTVRSVAFKIED